ncbi:unnamed protein product [Rotaria sp. Silwood2]|nr:unnamed protein product [Rotaria sp. Silwood2]CAF2909886.1 unnamed protein product [Rotaria sp. Silwood2]CAF3411855.1 unnamed protein product [Rotaria sp. Silwood2]CAF4593892.1 unnamed protein product [Rotaria sp. Silwood2]
MTSISFCSNCEGRPYDLICTCGDKFDFDCIHYHIEEIGTEIQEKSQMVSDKLLQLNVLQEKEEEKEYENTNAVQTVIDNWKRKRMQDINDIAEQTLYEYKRQKNVFNDIPSIQANFDRICSLFHRPTHTNLNDIIALGHQIQRLLEDHQNSSPTIPDDTNLDALLRAKLILSTSSTNNQELRPIEIEPQQFVSSDPVISDTSRFRSPELTNQLTNGTHTIELTNGTHTIELTNGTHTYELPNVVHTNELSNEIHTNELSNKIYTNELPNTVYTNGLPDEIRTNDLINDTRINDLTNDTRTNNLTNELPNTVYTNGLPDEIRTNDLTNDTRINDLTNDTRTNNLTNESTNNDEFDAGQTRQIQRVNTILIAVNNDKYAGTICCHNNQLIYNDYDRTIRSSRLTFIPNIYDLTTKHYIDWYEPDSAVGSGDDEWIQDITYSNRLSGYLILNRARLRLFKDYTNDLIEFQTFVDRTMKRLSCSDNHIYLVVAPNTTTYHGDEIVLMNYDKEEKVCKTFRDIMPTRMNRGAGPLVGEISDLTVVSNEKIAMGYRFERRHEVGICLFKISNDGRDWSCIKQLLLDDCWHNDLSYTPKMDWSAKLNAIILIEYMTGHLIVLDQDGQVTGECRFMHVENHRESPINLTVGTNNLLCARFESSIAIHKIIS